MAGCTERGPHFLGLGKTDACDPGMKSEAKEGCAFGLGGEEGHDLVLGETGAHMLGLGERSPSS